MISIQTPEGKKDLIFRGIMTPSGPKGIASGRITTPDGDAQFWEGSLAGLIVVAAPPFVSGAVAIPEPVPVVTSGTTISVSNGAPPYTYAWHMVSGAGSWTIENPTGPSTRFQAADVAGSLIAVFECVVTDARGATGEVQVPASVVNYGEL